MRELRYEDRRVDVLLLMMVLEVVRVMVRVIAWVVGGSGSSSFGFRHEVVDFLDFDFRLDSDLKTHEMRKDGQSPPEVRGRRRIERVLT